MIVVLAVLGFGGWRVFEHFDRAGKVQDAKRSCGTLDTPSNSVSLPPGFNWSSTLNTKAADAVLIKANGVEDSISVRALCTNRLTVRHTLH